VTLLSNADFIFLGETVDLNRDIVHKL